MKQQIIFPFVFLLLLFQLFFFIGQDESLDLSFLPTADNSEKITVPDKNKVADKKNNPEVEGVFSVTKVIDGDTIQISTGQKVRYIGVNTPETLDPRKPVECFGKEASARNKSLVQGKKVRLEKDTSTTDTFGRLLRYVYLQGSGKKEVFVNEKLVHEGYAQASAYPPDVKYQDKFSYAQKYAYAKQLGLWAAC